jgi:4-nitrophenyl phosphatase
MLDLSSIEGVVSDMDGVLWRGDAALPGVADMFDYLRQRAVPIVLATNNSSKSSAEYVDKLRHLGVRGLSERQIVTSRTVLLDYLLRQYAARSAIYVIGSPGMRTAIEDAGYRVSEEADIVVVGCRTCR